MDLEGTVRAPNPDRRRGKPFLGAAIECDDGTIWVIDHREESPYRDWAGRRVVVSGDEYRPEGQHLVGWSGGKPVRHFRVATMKPK